MLSDANELPGRYLLSVTTGAGRPFPYRTAVHRLLGAAPPAEKPVRFAPPLPPVSFQYVHLAAAAALEAAHASPRAQATAFQDPTPTPVSGGPDRPVPAAQREERVQHDAEGSVPKAMPQQRATEGTATSHSGHRPVPIVPMQPRPVQMPATTAPRTAETGGTIDTRNPNAEPSGRAPVAPATTPAALSIPGVTERRTVMSALVTRLAELNARSIENDPDVPDASPDSALAHTTERQRPPEPVARERPLLDPGSAARVALPARARDAVVRTESSGTQVRAPANDPEILPARPVQQRAGSVADAPRAGSAQRTDVAMQPGPAATRALAHDPRVRMSAPRSEAERVERMRRAGAERAGALVERRSRAAQREEGAEEAAAQSSERAAPPPAPPPRRIVTVVAAPAAETRTPRGFWSSSVLRSIHLRALR